MINDLYSLCLSTFLFAWHLTGNKLMCYLYQIYNKEVLMDGWMGTVLRVDLDKLKHIKVPLDKSIAKDYIGGRGLNSKVLFDEVKPRINPLSPDNVICMAPGVFTATPLGITGRLEVSTLSPYSGILGDGNVGGNFAGFFKKAGYDQIIITGKAEKPVYIWIDNDKIEILDASEIWGKNTWETTDYLTEKYGNNTSVLCIGQGGENLVRFASSIVDKYSSAARGSGAVLGSKNLKAIVVKGNGNANLAFENEFRKLAKEDREYFMTDPLQRDIIPKYGTHIGMLTWMPGYRYFEKYLREEEIPENLKPDSWKKFEIGRATCYSCPERCKNVYKIPYGSMKGEIGKGLEYEGIHCLGTNCGIMDPVSILEMENLADMFGMDVIGLGNSIAYAKKLYSLGIIDKGITDDLDLSWENAESQKELIYNIAFRKGFGKIVAEGLYSMGEILGKEAKEYCYHNKGLSRGVFPAGLFSLAHSTSTRGADHLRGRSWAFGENDTETIKMLQKKGLFPYSIEKDPIKAITISEKATTIADAIGRCKGSVNNWASSLPLVWKYPIFDGVAKLLTAATGIEYSGDDVEIIATRIYTLERCFNIRQGIKMKDDMLIQYVEDRETEKGRQEFEQHRDLIIDYYKLHGYDQNTGVPTGDTLIKLKLDFVREKMNGERNYPDWDGPKGL
jgi:aldehyde:ferredoxin oxidoreductase